jgi:hypothetical protein
MHLSKLRYLPKKYNLPPKFKPAVDVPEMLGIDKLERPEQGVSEPTNSEFSQCIVKTNIMSKYLERNDPLRHEDFFGVRDWFTRSDLMQARVHYGHKEGTLDPNMKHYMYGQRLGVCVFDLRHTEQHLHRALNFMAHLAFRDGLFLFVAHD